MSSKPTALRCDNPKSRASIRLVTKVNIPPPSSFRCTFKIHESKSTLLMRINWSQWTRDISFSYVLKQMQTAVFWKDFEQNKHKSDSRPRRIADWERTRVLNLDQNRAGKLGD